MNDTLNATASDQELLASLDGKLALVRDRTRSVAGGYTTGFHLWGEGGTSKTYTVQSTLDELGAKYKVTNARLTGRGLFDLLDAYPDHIHVLDDVESLFADKTSHGVLRSALWGQGDAPRLVVWQTGPTGRREVVFNSGLILIANCALGDNAALRALATRIDSVRFHPAPDELAALMRAIAEKGFEHKGRALPAEVCREVADEVLARTTRLNRALDLRLLVNTFRDRLQFDDGQAEVHWTDLLESRMQGRAVAPKKPLRAVGREREREVARAIAHLPRDEKVRQWAAETGKSQATMYRRLGEASQDSQLRN
jgi:hypothetical protein